MEELIAAIARGLVEDKESVTVKADAPAEDETIAPQGTHVTGTQTVTHEYLTLNGKVLEGSAWISVTKDNMGDYNF